MTFWLPIVSGAASAVAVGNRQRGTLTWNTREEGCPKGCLSFCLSRLEQHADRKSILEMPMPQMPGGGMPGMDGPPSMLPKNPAGGPAGPGSSPALSPGGGKGTQGAAREQVKVLLDALYQLQGAFPVDSDEYGAVLDAIRALRGTFKQSKSQSGLEPAARQQLAARSTEGKPFANVPPAGMQAGKPPLGQMPQMPGGMPGG
ncbi:MAG: hypothetical protein KGL39_12410 [Patescibacteria group bacterium]|nr:hypothetical protein [Patescibacteria group bacterium]